MASFHRISSAPTGRVNCESGGALSVPELLEHVLAAGEWVRPEGHPRQHLDSVSDVDIRLAGLRPGGRSLALEFDAAGSWNGAVWRVTVNGDTGTTATAVLNYGEHPPEAPAAPTGGLIGVRAQADEGLWCDKPTPTARLPHPALATILARAESSVGRLKIGRLAALQGARNATAVHIEPGGGLAMVDGRVALRLDGVEQG